MAKQPQIEAEAVRDHHEQIVLGLAAGVIAVDREGRIISVNPAAYRHLNIAPEDLRPGMAFAGVKRLAPFMSILEEASQDARDLQRREVTIGDDPLNSKSIGVSVSLLSGPLKYNGAILLFSDLTERRRLERAAEVNRQLASLGELAAGVVHQLRNPLTIIQGRSEMLLRRLKEEKDQQSAKAIMNEAKALEQSIRQFLSFAKPFELRFVSCLADDVIARAIDLNRKHADERRVKLGCGQRCAEPLYVDRDRLAEALGNIVSNALDAVGEGGEVELRARVEDGLAVFQVLDNGPGIHLEPGEDLFSPFLTKKRDGTGLGLSVVQRIVSAHNGHASYGNRSEGGAWFELRVPVRPDGG